MLTAVIPDEHARALDRIAAKRGTSRSALVRELVGAAVVSMARALSAADASAAARRAALPDAYTEYRREQWRKSKQRRRKISRESSQPSTVAS